MKEIHKHRHLDSNRGPLDRESETLTTTLQMQAISGGGKKL